MSTNKIHIALVTAWFPPQKGVAVNRMQAFAKYLEEFEFKVSVITISTSNAATTSQTETSNVYRLTNPSFLSYIKEKAGEPRIVHLLKIVWNFTLTILGVEKYAAWQKEAIKTLEGINQKEKIDVVISSYAPEEAHLAAYQFCIKHPSIKWIADMRDEMSKNPHLNLSSLKRLLEVEKIVNQRATAVTTVSEPILNDFRQLLPNIRHFEEIRNGYDHSVLPSNNFNEVFTICYAGTFYGAIKPNTFLSALSEFLAQIKEAVEIQFIGTHKNFDIPKSIEKYCRFIPPLDNTKAIELISKADANLLIIPSIKRKGMYGGKLFDYLSVQKPILAVIDTGDVAADLIKELKAGYIADFNNTNEILQAIQQAYSRWKKKQLFSADSVRIEPLHRKHQVKKLALLINKILEA